MIGGLLTIHTVGVDGQHSLPKPSWLARAPCATLKDNQRVSAPPPDGKLSCSRIAPWYLRGPGESEEGEGGVKDGSGAWSGDEHSVPSWLSL
jgi:hypothetical protein